MSNEKKRDERQLMKVCAPEPLEVGEKQFGLRSFVEWLINTPQPGLASNKPGLLASVRIDARLTNLSETDDLLCEWRDLELLTAAARSPAGPYPLVPARRVLRFIEALEDAEEVSDASG